MKNKLHHSFQFLVKHIFAIKITVSLIIILIFTSISIIFYRQVITLKNKNDQLIADLNNKKQQSSEQKAKIIELERDLENPEFYTLVHNKCTEEFCLFDRGGLSDGYFKINGYYKYLEYPSDEYGFGGQFHQLIITQIPEYFDEELMKDIGINKSENAWYLPNLNFDNLNYTDKQKILNSTPNNQVEIKIIKTTNREKAGPFTNSSQYLVISVN